MIATNLFVRYWKQIAILVVLCLAAATGVVSCVAAVALSIFKAAVETPAMIAGAMTGNPNSILQLSLEIAEEWEKSHIVNGHACAAITYDGTPGDAPDDAGLFDAINYNAGDNNRLALAMTAGVLWASKGKANLVVNGRVGAYQINFPGSGDNVLISVKEAKNPAQATNYELPFYENAMNTVDPSKWATDPLGNAAQVAYAVQHPTKDYKALLGKKEFEKRGKAALAKLKKSGISVDFSVAPKVQDPANAPITGRPALVGPDTPTKIYNYLIGRGLQPYQAEGIMGNMQQESSMNPAIQQDGSHDTFPKNGVGFGLIQWTFTSRQQPLVDLAHKAGVSPTDLGVQLDYIWQELHEGAYASVLPKLMATTTLVDATTVWFNDYEQPGDSSLPTRIGYAQQFQDQFAKLGGGIIVDPKCAAANSSAPPVIGSILDDPHAVQRQVEILAAEAEKGVRYSWGGGDYNGPTVGIHDYGVADRYGDYLHPGFDCSGLVYYALGKAGIKTLPRTSAAQYEYLKQHNREVPRDKARPGDLVYFKNSAGTVHHVGIYIGNGKMINAPQSGDVVRESSVDDNDIIAGFFNPFF